MGAEQVIHHMGGGALGQRAAQIGLGFPKGNHPNHHGIVTKVESTPAFFNEVR